jgi:integrase
MFHTGIRPTELLKVRLSMIDLNNDFINIDKKLQKKKPRVVKPINKYQRLIFERDLDSFQNDLFIWITRQNIKAKS